MSDSLLDLGITPYVLTAKPDWANLPSRSQDFGRDIIQYDAGISSLRNLTNDLSQRMEYGYSSMTKEEEYYLLNFFHSRKGRLQRFWLPVYFRDFELADAITSASYILKVKDNGAYVNLKYYERVFIELYDGSLLTRQILSSLDAETLVMLSEWDRDIAIADVAHFGKLLLCRFDQDEIEVNHVTDEIGTTALSFQELSKEYVLNNVTES
jgi:hypothetical protein